MPTLTPRPVEYLLLEVELPGQDCAPAGVLLLDPAEDRLLVQLREDWTQFAGDEAEVLAGIADTIASMATDHGAAEALRLVENTLSGTLRASDRRQTVAADPEARLRRLFREYVPVSGGVPVIDLRAAAGGWSEEQLPGDVIGETAPPSGVRTGEGWFAARVEGRSMEPLIPDGSLCLFRPHRGGSRDGSRLLIERLGGGAEGSRFTVKVYRSEKRSSEDGGWEHAAIRMIPLNPEFPEWRLEGGEFRVLGEFVTVLPGEE